MKLEFRDDRNLMVSDQEPGSFFNASSEFVLLRMPDADELRVLWQEFDHELRTALKELLLAPYGDILEKLGPLGFAAKEADGRLRTLFGMLTSGTTAKSAHFRKSAMTKAMIALELIPDKTPHGKARKRIPRGEGSVEEYAIAMSKDDQVALIDALVDLEDVDEWMLVSQGSQVGWQELRKAVLSASDIRTFLSQLATDTDRLMGDDETRTVRFASANDKITFAPAWFAQWLARRGVWAWPARYVSRVMYLYPARFSPMATRMSVADHHRGFADLVFRYHQGQRNTGASMAIQAFVTAALCGNTWQDDFRWYPLAAFKEAAGTFSSRMQLTTSINAIYKLAIEHVDGKVNSRPEAQIFLTSVRIGKIGVDAFNWTSMPTPYNTQVASKMLGHPITTIPEYVVSWAAQFRALLPLFQVKTIKSVERSLSLWLIFLMTLDPEDAPLDFQSISRPKHVHDLRNENSHAFWNFLDAFFRSDSRDQGNRAISDMRKAFHLASVRDSFQHETNPFDAKLDKIGRGYTQRADVTPRKPLELEAWELIVRKNRENDYAFARSLGPKRFHHTLRNPTTGEYETVFWPAEPIVVDIILNSGMRHISARWVDSGEGDENRLDPGGMRLVPNPHPAATIGRKDSFLQLVSLPGRETRKIVGMKVGVNKTGAPFVIPWTDNHIVSSFYRMLDLQTTYNPIAAPVKPTGKGTWEVARANPELYPDIYPLFRDPGVALNTPVSDNKVLSYWKDLLRVCQPAVNQLFGHEYPLITDAGAVFDLHALRVTMVSNLLAAGVPIEIVRDLVGHATWMMTFHYNGRRSAKLHTTLQEAMQMRSEAHDRLASGDRDAILEYADEAVTPEFVENHVGVGMLRTYADRTTRSPFEIFFHGICPGGTCATGGEKVAEGKYKPVWRERACSGCRYRVTGPKFRPGIVNRINNLMAEMRLSAKRAKDLGDRIEQDELRAGKPAHALRRLQRAESSFKDQLSKEYTLESKILEMINQVQSMAAAEGKSAENLLLPSVPHFDPENLGYGFAEVHEFELMHTLVKEARILPAAIMEIPQGVEAHFKGMVREILRANNIADLMIRLPSDKETDACLQVGDVLLERYPEVSRFQQLREGAIQIDPDALEDVRREVSAALASSAAPARQIEFTE
ncbi:hypothetical protein GGQ99_002332 [Aminobacter niigataensis]|uniref:Phage integrase family protein n=1 Tax=Aminobacter niigataensis TaxID=83265 RepID=A0ABR6L1E0_9HYPH|nr:VPA1269 family protein [Aminobacter niigataensis]MBB4650577.1 hypothetical protein [Aminobacter niigataensis]